MTAQPGPGTPSGALRLPPLPNPPRKSDMQEYLHFDLPAVTEYRRFDHTGAVNTTRPSPVTS